MARTPLAAPDANSSMRASQHIYQTTVPNDVVASLAEWCDIRVLAQLSGVCSAFARVVHREKSLRISRTVVPWIGPLNIPKFLHGMEYHGFVISGALALKMCLAASFECNTLTLVVPKGDDASSLIVFVRGLGFQRTHDPDRVKLHRNLYDARTSFVYKVQTFSRQSDMRCIEIVQSVTPYALDAVLSHPSTLMQNFVSAHYYGSFYPWFTFKNISVTVSPTTPNRAVSSQLAMYRDLGFQTYASNRFLTTPCGSKCPLEHHTIYDPIICISRHSTAQFYEEKTGVPPGVVREWIWELDERVHFRLTSQCHNPACPRRNVQ